MYDVAIVGGGVVGCAIARELSRYRLHVVLLERQAEVAFGTSKTNSGIVHAGQQTDPGTLKGTLEVLGNKLFDRLADELGFGFRRCGELVVAQTEAELPQLEVLKKRGEERGVPGLEIWDRDRLRREEPNLSTKLTGALVAPTAGVINPYEFAFALIESAQRNGVELKIECPVEDIEVRSGHLTLRTPAGRLDARYVVNCAGVMADRVADMVGLRDFTIRPRKGEEYMLDKRLQGIVKRVIFPLPSPTSKGTLIIPTYDGTLMVGPTAVDVEDRDDLTTTPEGSEQVFANVRKLCPCIDERSTIAEFAGLRAVSGTGDFIIGPTRVRGFVNVAGIQSPGLTASPAIAQYVCDQLGREGLQLIEREGWEPRIEPPSRFARQPLERQRELAAKDPRFGKMVCRCELVTEAEVHEAIDHGARTLDGVKFRTRAGMGRCQGGFCTARIMEILSERLGLPLSEVTKRGAGSWIVRPWDEEAAR